MCFVCHLKSLVTDEGHSLPADGTLELANEGSLPRLRPHVRVGSYWEVLYAKVRVRLPAGCPLSPLSQTHAPR
jgi:hypothetical protein